MNAERVQLIKSLIGGHYDFTTKISLCKFTRVDENNFKERDWYG
jgi:hypothetical protein